MQVKCIDVDRTHGKLTLGQTYEAEEHNTRCYLIQGKAWRKDRFTVCSDDEEVAGISQEQLKDPEHILGYDCNVNTESVVLPYVIPEEKKNDAIRDRLLEQGKLNENPKFAFGGKKPRLTLAPLSATLAQIEAQLDGALKYGEVNWRKNKVDAKTYIDAGLRHFKLYEHGEKLARDTKVQNLGAVMACCAILIDAELHGMLIDNRDISPEACQALHDAEAMVAHLKDMQAQREAAKSGQ